MLVAEAELVRVRRRAKQLWLPVTRGSTGERKGAPVEKGKCVSLQTRPFAKGIRITIAEVLLTTLGQMTDTDAQAQGYRDLKDAVKGWARLYGDAGGEVEAWRISILHGNQAKFFEDHAEQYLRAKMGGGRDYTTMPEQAVRGEGAVATADQIKQAHGAAIRAAAEAQRALETYCRGERRALEQLATHRSSLPADTRKELAWRERRLERLEKHLTVAA